MRVLFVSNLYPPNVMGGYERLCFEVASAFADAGHTVSVLTSNHGGARADHAHQTIDQTLRLLTGATIYQPFTGEAVERTAINAVNVEALSAAVAKHRPQMIYSWNLFFLDRTFLDALASSGVPVSVMLTDNWLANMIVPEYVASVFRDHVFGNQALRKPTPRGLVVLQRLFARPTASRASVVPAIPLPVTAIYGSDFMRRFYHASGLRFAQETVIHNGVRQERHSESAFRDRSEPVVAGELRILFAGRLVDLKGADTAVAALGHLTASVLHGQQVRLTLVGDEQDLAYVARLHAIVTAYGGAAVIDRCPAVPASDLFGLFAAHDIYVFPSLYEPFSLTLIHALACGIPTIASDAGGNVEIVKDGVSGLIFAKGDAADLGRQIGRLASDPALRKRLSRGAREAARRFDFDTMIARTEAFFRDLRTA